MSQGSFLMQAGPRVPLLTDPISTADDGLSPVLTLGPNPHFGDLASPTAAPKKVSTAFGGEISAGKNSYVYDAHTYHTKVPPEGIKLLIQHFTRETDTVLDPFCGSGMTGVAALELGRRAVLSDLSPAAAFIAYNHCTPIDDRAFLSAVRELLDAAEPTERDLYSTRCRECGENTTMLYMVWSYGVLCRDCGEEFLLWDVARDERPRVRESKIRSEFSCPHCKRLQRKRGLTRTLRYPVQIGYRCCSSGARERTTAPDDADLERINRIEREGTPLHLWYPTDDFPNGVNTQQAIRAGITSVDKAYTPRALHSMALLWNLASRWPTPSVRAKLQFALTSLYQRVTLFSEFRFWGGSGNIANYNVPSIINEQNVFRTFERKARTIAWYFRDAPRIRRDVRLSVQSASHLVQLPDASIDYIFADPPFGGNINYSEMNFLWESWLQVKTDTHDEAIVNRYQQKGVREYEELLRQSFAELRRVLKDGGWFSLVFHNSSASVWSALQNALSGSGWRIVGTQTFDKKHGTFKQFVSDNAVGYDLVLHCRKKPRSSLPRRVSVLGARSHARAFLLSALASENGCTYVVRYLHVKRAAEFDYRRLYADWLKSAVGNGSVALGFEEFRKLVDDVRPEI
jgi:DNA modification methylase